MDENPYASPVDAAIESSVSSSSESVRQAHIKHEASIKSIGTLYLLGSILLIPVSLIILATPVLSAGGYDGPPIVMAAIGVAYLALGIAQFATAIGLWKLQIWAKWVAVVLSSIGLLGFPIGTLISAYILYLLLNAKGQIVFSPEYKQVIAETPHIKYRTSKVVVALLVLLIAILGLAVVAAMLA